MENDYFSRNTRNVKKKYKKYQKISENKGKVGLGIALALGGIIANTKTNDSETEESDVYEASAAENVVTPGDEE